MPVRTLEDLIRHKASVDGCKRFALMRRPDGRWEASMVHRDGSTATCDVSGDPADALWNVVAPFPMQRRFLPSGREAVIEGTVHGVREEDQLLDSGDDDVLLDDEEDEGLLLE